MADASNNVVQCPHCDADVIIIEIACGIFRHGVLKTNGEQIPPHESRENCERLVAADEIYGCGKPFRVIANESGMIAEVCDYI